MNEILHANIFFLIASIATVCFCILGCFVLYQLVKIMQLVRSILGRVEAGSEALAGDLEDIRMFFSEGGFITRLLGYFMGQKETRTTKKKRSERITKN